MYVCDTDTPTISPGACGANFIWAFGLQYQIRRAIVSNVRSCFVWTDTDLIEPSVIQSRPHTKDTHLLTKCKSKQKDHDFLDGTVYYFRYFLYMISEERET